jgi:DNA mismatch repair ATPase MutS
LVSISALFSYLDVVHDIVFAQKSLQFKFEGLQNQMMVDHVTAKNLELVANSLGKGPSLFTTLNHTQTAMGARYF